jgi:dCTP deaminase
MGVLVKNQIIERLKSGDISFTPALDKFQLQPHSIDLRLGYTFLVSKNSRLTDKGRVAVRLDYQKSSSHFDVVELEEGQYFEILPNEYLVVSTLEKIKLPNDIMAILYPRSSVNRRGLSVDLSGVIDAGYEGNLIVPLRNNTQNQIVKLYPGERFCQLVFSTLETPVQPKRSRYAKKDIVVGSLGERHATEQRLVRVGKIKELKQRYLFDFDKKRKS